MCQKSALQCQLACLYVLYTVNPSPLPLAAIHNGMGEVMSSILLHVGFFSVNTFCQKDVVCITRHVVTTISAFSFTMPL
jgi:hypothetical protein